MHWVIPLELVQMWVPEQAGLESLSQSLDCHIKGDTELSYLKYLYNFPFFLFSFYVHMCVCVCQPVRVETRC